MGVHDGPEYAINTPRLVERMLVGWHRREFFMKRLFGLLFLFVTFNVSAMEINSKLSGVWYNANQDGHGLNVVTFDENYTLIYWYVYHIDGTPMFLLTVGQNQGNSTTGITYYNTGMKFGEFNPDDRVETVWGTSTLTFSDCNTASLEYSSNDPAYGSGTIPMTRVLSVTGLKCSDSPLHGSYSGSWADSGEVGYGIAVLFENGDMAFFSASTESAAVGIGEWWVTGSNRFSFNTNVYSVFGGARYISGYGTFSEDDLTASYTGNGNLFATPMPSFQHSLDTAKMAGEYNIYDWDDMYAGTALIQDDGSITGTTNIGCTIDGKFVVPNTQFNQAYLLDASISGCGATLYGQGAAVYRNTIDEIVIAAADGTTGYVWTLKRK